MTKILLSEAAELVPVSKPTLYRHAQERKFSWDKDAQGRKVADPAELQRFYGTLNKPTSLDKNSHQDSSRQTDNLETMAVLQTKNEYLSKQVEDLKRDKEDLKRDFQEAREHNRSLDNKITELLQKHTLLLEDKREKQEQPPPQQPIDKRMVYAILGVCGLSFSIPLVAWVVQSGFFAKLLN